jgi:hypothetical protein
MMSNGRLAAPPLPADSTTGTRLNTRSCAGSASGARPAWLLGAADAVLPTAAARPPATAELPAAAAPRAESPGLRCRSPTIAAAAAAEAAEPAPEGLAAGSERRCASRGASSVSVLRAAWPPGQRRAMQSATALGRACTPARRAHKRFADR